MAGTAIPGVPGAKGISELQMEAVRLLNEDQVSPVPTTPLCPRPKSTLETCILAVRLVEQGGPYIGRGPSILNLVD